MPFVSSVRGSFGLAKRPRPSFIPSTSNSTIDGGSITTSGGYRIHTYVTGSQSGNSYNFTITPSVSVGNGVDTVFPVEYLILAGGGGGEAGHDSGGGGGQTLIGTVNAPIGTNSVVVGGGGSGGPQGPSGADGGQGGTSSVFGISAQGGFGEGRSGFNFPAGSGQTGAGGTNGNRPGAPGTQSSISGSNLFYGGGGGGAGGAGYETSPGGPGGQGGGGTGGRSNFNNATAGENGFGGGGGSGGIQWCGQVYCGGLPGGSGRVIIRYQNN